MIAKSYSMTFSISITADCSSTTLVVSGEVFVNMRMSREIPGQHVVACGANQAI